MKVRGRGRGEGGEGRVFLRPVHMMERDLAWFFDLFVFCKEKTF